MQSSILLESKSLKLWLDFPCSIYMCICIYFSSTFNLSIHQSKIDESTEIHPQKLIVKIETETYFEQSVIFIQMAETHGSGEGSTSYGGRSEGLGAGSSHEPPHEVQLVDKTITFDQMGLKDHYCVESTHMDGKLLHLSK